MRRTHATNNVASIPTPSTSGTAGFHRNRTGPGTPGTILDADDLNIHQEELVALAILRGATLDDTGATRNQCAAAVSPVKALDGEGGGGWDSVNDHLGIAGSGTLSGTRDVSIASTGGTTTGTGCVEIATSASTNAGDKARASLECRINRTKPEHTIVEYVYA